MQQPGAVHRQEDLNSPVPGNCNTVPALQVHFKFSFCSNRWNLKKFFFTKSFLLHQRRLSKNQSKILNRISVLILPKWVKLFAGLGICSFQKNVPFFAFFCVLYKECSVLSVLYKRTFRSFSVLFLT